MPSVSQSIGSIASTDGQVLDQVRRFQPDAQAALHAFALGKLCYIQLSLADPSAGAMERLNIGRKRNRLVYHWRCDRPYRIPIRSTRCLRLFNRNDLHSSLRYQPSHDLVRKAVQRYCELLFLRLFSSTG